MQSGVIEQVSPAAIEATDGRLGIRVMGLLFGPAVLSSIVDRRQHPVRRHPEPDRGRPDRGHWPGGQRAVGAGGGADLGGNATASSASSNVVVLGIAERAGHRISFREFTRDCLVVTVVTVSVSAPYLRLRYL